MSELKPKRKLQAINSNTIYDVPAKLAKLSRIVRDGKLGKIRNCIVILEANGKDSNPLTGYHYGYGSRADLIVMLERIKRDILL